MWVFNKGFENIEENDISELLSKEVMEHQNLEYKERSYGRSDEDTRELLRDITSIANAYGGYLIIGIRENESGTPIEITGVENAEAERDRIQACCLSSIDSRIPGLQIRSVPMRSRHPVIIISIPRSTRAPHVITFKGLSQFWIRHDRQKSRMSVEEIREACLRTEDIRKSIEEFIKDRKQEIIEEIGREPTYVIGAAPILIKDDIIDINDKNLREMLRHPPHQRYDGCNLDFGLNNFPRPTLYGLRIERDFRKVEIFRNGYLQSKVKIIDYFLKLERIEKESSPTQDIAVLNALPLVEYAVSFYRLLKGVVGYLGLNEPFVGFLSAYNVGGMGLRRFAKDRGDINDYYGPHSWHKAHLEIPPMQILSFENPDNIAKDFVDRIWNAFGYDKAPLFRDDNKFELAPYGETKK